MLHFVFWFYYILLEFVLQRISVLSMYRTEFIHLIIPLTISLTMRRNLMARYFLEWFNSIFFYIMPRVEFNLNMRFIKPHFVCDYSIHFALDLDLILFLLPVKELLVIFNLYLALINDWHLFSEFVIYLKKLFCTRGEE